MGDAKNKPEVEGGHSGRVIVDDRGRNVWHWNDVRVDIESTTILLKRLDNDALALEPTQRVPIVPDRGKTQARVSRSVSQDDELAMSASLRIDAGSGGGFDPYNRS